MSSGKRRSNNTIFFAISVYEKGSSGPRALIAASAASILAMVVGIRRVEVEVVVRRARTLWSRALCGGASYCLGAKNAAQRARNRGAGYAYSKPHANLARVSYKFS